MSVASRTMKRNSQIKTVAKSLMQKWEKATIHSVDGNRANIRLGASPTTIKNVEISGDGSYLKAGEEVTITWKDGRPVVLPNVIPVTLPLTPEEKVEPLAYYSRRDILLDIFKGYWGYEKNGGVSYSGTNGSASNYQTMVLRVLAPTMRLLALEWDINISGDYSVLYTYTQAKADVYGTIWTGNAPGASPVKMTLGTPVVLPRGLHYFCLVKATGTGALRTQASYPYTDPSGDFIFERGYADGVLSANIAPVRITYQTAPAFGTDF